MRPIYVKRLKRYTTQMSGLKRTKEKLCFKNKDFIFLRKRNIKLEYFLFRKLLQSLLLKFINLTSCLSFINILKKKIALFINVFKLKGYQKEEKNEGKGKKWNR